RRGAALRRDRRRGGVVRRADAAAGAASVGGAVRRAADDPRIRDELRVGWPRHVSPGFRRRSGDRRVHVLPDRLPARRGRAARPRPCARGDRPLARPQRTAGVLPSGASAAPAGAARRHAARRPRRADRVRRVRRAEVPDVLVRRLRAVPARLQRLGRGRAPVPALAVCAAIVAISDGIPVGMLVHWSTQSSHAALASAGGNLKYLFPATLTSLEVGVAAAAVALVLALPVAVAAVRYRGARVTVLERATYLSFALPDLVAAIALAYAASHYVRFLYGSFFLLVFAEGVLFLPFAVVALRAT